MESAKKRLRQNRKRNVLNRSHKSALKTQIKHFLGAAKEGSAEAAEKELRLTVKKLDKAAAKGILHKNTASRKKSRLTRQLNKIKNAASKKG